MWWLYIESCSRWHKMYMEKTWTSNSTFTFPPWHAHHNFTELSNRPLWYARSQYIFHVLRQLRDLLFQKCCCMSFIPPTLLTLLGDLFSTNFLTHFCKILKESNVGLFLASKISHVLPQIKFLIFQKNPFLVLTPQKL